MSKSLIPALIALVFIIACMFQFAPATASSFKTTDQVLNITLDEDADSLKTVSGCATTEFEKATLAPDTESVLTFSSSARRWSFTNLAGTCPVYINFDAPATLEVSYKVPAGGTVAFETKVTAIHAIAADTIETQALAGY